LPAKEELVDKSISARIDAMAKSDKITAVVFTIAMWIVLIFTFFAVYRIAPTSEISVVLAVSFILLGGFNTASMIAMIRGYAKDKDFIYREDILNLDRMKKRKHSGVVDEPKHESGETTRPASPAQK